MLSRVLAPTTIEWLRGAKLPTEWTASKVKYVAMEMRAGDAITAEAIEESGLYPVYGGNGLRGYTEAKNVTGTRILIGRQGALCGNVHLVSGDFWASEHAIVVTPSQGVDPRWLAHVLQVMDLGQYSQTAAQPGIGTGQIGPLQLPVPPSEEQCAIAQYLDYETAQIDALIAKQQQLIATLRERHVATISRAVESSGELTPFRRVFKTIRQGWSPNCDPEPADGITTWGVLKAGCSNSGRFDATQNKRLPFHEIPRPEHVVNSGEIVMSRSNTKELVGSAAFVDRRYPRLMLSDLTYAIRLRPDMDPAFTAYALRARRARTALSTMAKGTSPTMQKISQRDIRELEIRLPSLHEQCRIASELDAKTVKLDSLIAKTQRFIELSKERRAALITAAVTGQIDVRDQQMSRGQSSP